MAMILRIVLGRFAAAEPGVAPVQACIVTVWRDVDAMVRATSIDEQARFIGTSLQLRLRVERTDHYEIVGRTFAALPPDATALVRILTVHAGSSDEAALVSTLRAQQPRLVAHGLVASHLGRRIAEDRTVDAVHVSVWPDRAAIDAATGGEPEVPFFAAELHAWQDRLTLEMFDGIEIAPRLPTPSGAPLLILDGQARIVDLTTAAAAMLGMSSDHFVGKSIAGLTAPLGGRALLDWDDLFRHDSLQGETALAVPDVGEIIVRVVAARDTPVPGRHAVMVRRADEPPPTLADLAAAIDEAFRST